MSTYAIYDKTTGEITASISCPASQLAANTPDGCASIESEHTGETHWVVDGAAVALPERPGPHWQFDYRQKVWVHDVKGEAAKVRGLRDRLLAACDWTQLPDVPIETKSAWATYRQALRDVPQQAGFPTDIVWPEAPE